MRASGGLQNVPEGALARPFRGPKRFRQNASIAISGRELVITDENAAEHRFDLDDRGPYRAGYVKDRFVIVDAEGRAVLVTRSHLWDIGALFPFEVGLGLAGEITGPPTPRDDAVVMRDRQVWDLVPRIALGPFMVGPFILRGLADSGAIAGSIALGAAALCLVIVAVSGVALVKQARRTQVQSVRRKAPAVMTLVNERGDVAAEIDLTHATRLRLQRFPAMGELMAFEAGTTAVPIDAHGGELAAPFPLELRTEDLLDVAADSGITLEVVPYDPVPPDQTIELTPYRRGGAVELAARDDLVLRDRKGRATTVPRTGERAPGRVALVYAGYPYFPHLQARLLLLDRTDRVIVETPLKWWETKDEGYRPVFAFARALGLPVELIDGRWRARRRPLAPGGFRYVHRPVLWYSIGIISLFLVPLLAYFAVFAVNDFVTELSEGLMTTVSLLAFGIWALLFATLTLTRGTFRVWSKRG